MNDAFCQSGFGWGDPGNIKPGSETGRAFIRDSAAANCSDGVGPVES